MSAIQRKHTGPLMSEIVIHNGIVYLSGVIPAPEAEGKDIATQCHSVLAQIDELLEDVGTHKSRLLTAQIWLTDIENDMSTMNEIWEAWLDPNGVPTRATVEAKLLRPTVNIEIQVTAALL